MTPEPEQRYPRFVCHPCGQRHGRRGTYSRTATWHEGECGVCGAKAVVTQPRDFGHLRDSWRGCRR